MHHANLWLWLFVFVTVSWPTLLIVAWCGGWRGWYERGENNVR